jgi:L,D-transpeptidase catalytic domain
MNKTLRYVLVSTSLLCVTILIIFIFRGNSKITPSNIFQTKDIVATSTQSDTKPDIKTFNYIRIKNACDWTAVGTCVNMRSGTTMESPVVGRLRDGVVLKVGDIVEVNGQTWYKIIFGTELRYPERVRGGLYVAKTDSVELFTDIGDEEADHLNASTTKRIVVDVSQQTLYAYEGDTLFMKELISTGLEYTPTPRGTFFVFKKTPSRYMQGPIPGISDQYYDLPGVPWDLYFTTDGAVIHGAYWHDKFGQPWSHGCVNLPPDQAEKLYKWADIGMPIFIKN